MRQRLCAKKHSVAGAAGGRLGTARPCGAQVSQTDSPPPALCAAWQSLRAPSPGSSAALQAVAGRCRAPRRCPRASFSPSAPENRVSALEPTAAVAAPCAGVSERVVRRGARPQLIRLLAGLLHKPELLRLLLLLKRGLRAREQRVVRVHPRLRQDGCQIFVHGCSSGSGTRSLRPDADKPSEELRARLPLFEQTCRADGLVPGWPRTPEQKAFSNEVLREAARPVGFLQASCCRCTPGRRAEQPSAAARRRGPGPRRCWWPARGSFFA